MRGEGVSRSRWLFGMVVGLLLVGVVAAGGIALGGGGPPSGAVGAENQVYMTLEIPGITDDAPEGVSEVMSFSWGMSNPGSGRIVVQEFVISKQVDKSSPKLYQAFADGKHIKVAILSIYEGRGGQTSLDFKEYVVYAMEDALIVSVKVSSSPDSPLPTEEVSFIFQKISMDFTSQGGATEALQCGTGADWNGCDRI